MTEIIASIIKNVLKVDKDQDLDSQEHNLIQMNKMLDTLIVKFYYIIFVKSQEQTKFMKMSELEQEIEINKQEQKDYDDLLKAVDKGMRKC